MNKNIDNMLKNQHGSDILDKGQEEKLLNLLDELDEAIKAKRDEVKNSIINIIK